MTADESARIFPETTLTAGDLTLRPLTEADADDITVACQDAETLRWLPLPRPYTRAGAEWFIGTYAPHHRESGAGVVFAIESAGRLVGAIDLKDVDWAAKVAEVGYWVAPWARGRGVASEATRSLARWAIHEHGFERVELFAATGNLASQRAAEKAGLTREGIARNAGCLHDSRVDLVVYSMVRDDLPTSSGDSHDGTIGDRRLPGGEPVSLLTETVAAIKPASTEAMAAAEERQSTLTKPRGSLGALEELGTRLCGMYAECPPPLPEPVAIAVFAGDHGVHAQGVSPWPQEVTAQMVGNFLAGGAVINALGRQVGAEVVVVDMGVAGEVPQAPNLMACKIAKGTADLTKGPAMTAAQVQEAVEVGIAVARTLVAQGNRLLVTGDMGIANTTASAALISVFTGQDAAEVTGRGTGIDDAMLDHKVSVIETAIRINRPSSRDPLAALAGVGGLEHAGVVGCLLGAAALRTPVILDGVIACSAALVARAIAPHAADYWVAGHRSVEPGAGAALAHLDLMPLVDLGMRLGEGSGAALAVPLVQASARILREVSTFDSAGVTDKE